MATSSSESGPLTLSTLTAGLKRPGSELENDPLPQYSLADQYSQYRPDRYSDSEDELRSEMSLLRDAIDRKLIEKQAQLRRERPALSLTSTASGIEPSMEVVELEERLQRQLREDTAARIRMIEDTIQQRSRACSRHHRRSVAASIDASQRLEEEPETRVRKRRPSSSRKYEFLNNRYSKFNTKSPWAKSTFAHDVRSMENQTYTYHRKPASKAHSRQSSDSMEVAFLQKVLRLAESHAEEFESLCKQCQSQCTCDCGVWDLRKFDPRQPYSPLDDPSQSRDAENQLFERRKLRPAKDERPNSAKLDSKSAKPRPVSATKRTPVLLANIGRQRVYAPPKEIKPRSKPALWDKERMAEEQLALKVENNGLRDENMKLKTRVNQLEKEVLRFGEVLDGQGSEKPAHTHFVTSLKQAVKELRAEVKTKDDEIGELRRNIKTTRTTELEVELQAYIDECTRLRRHLEQVMAAPSDFFTAETPFNKDSLRIQQGAAISSLQLEKDSVRSQLEQAELELERWKERAKDLEKKAKKQRKSPDRQLKNDLSRLKTAMETAEKEKGDLLASFEFEKSRLAAEGSSKDEQIRKLQTKIAEAESAAQTLQKQSMEQLQELKSVKNQLTEMQHEVVLLTKRVHGTEQTVKTGKPVRVFEKIHRYIEQKHTLPDVFFSLLDRLNKGTLDARELLSGLKKHGIRVKTAAVEEAVMVASGGKTVVSLNQLEEQYLRYDFSLQYESSSSEEESPKLKKGDERKDGRTTPQGENRGEKRPESRTEGKKTEASKPVTQTEPKQSAFTEQRPPVMEERKVVQVETKPAVKVEPKPEVKPEPRAEQKPVSTEVSRPVEVPKPAIEEGKRPPEPPKAVKEEPKRSITEMPKPAPEEAKRPPEEPTKPVREEPKRPAEVPKPVPEEAKKSAEAVKKPVEEAKKPAEEPKRPSPPAEPKPAEVKPVPRPIPESGKRPSAEPPKPLDTKPQEPVIAANESQPVAVSKSTEQKNPPLEAEKLAVAKRPASPMRAPTPTEAAKPIPGTRSRPAENSDSAQQMPVEKASSLHVPLSPNKEVKIVEERKDPPAPLKSHTDSGKGQVEAAVSESQKVKSDRKDPPKPLPSKPQAPVSIPTISRAEVSGSLRHIALRLQIHRLTKEKLPLLLFGQSYDDTREVSLFELQELLAQPPMNITDPPQAELLSKFLLEVASGSREVAHIGEVVTRLNKNLADWEIFSTEHEEQYDDEIAEMLQDKFAAIQSACEAADPDRSEYISMAQFQGIMKKVGVKLNKAHLQYLELLFYSHDMQLDKVPYYQFLRAYSGEKEEGEDEEHYSDEEYGSGDYEMDDEAREELVHSYLSALASALTRARKKPKDVFDVSEGGRIYPPEFVFGVRALGMPELRKEDLIVVLESLQDEDAEELCVSLSYLEEVLAHIGARDEYDEVQEAESSGYFPPSMEYSEDSPEKPIKRSAQLSEDSPFATYSPHSAPGKSASKRSLPRSGFPPQHSSDSEAEEVIDEGQDDEDEYEEEGFEDDQQEESIASNISY